jgi:regulator of cell morphogenesis and NO signaling
MMTAIDHQSSLADVIDECPGASCLFMELGIDPARHEGEAVDEVAKAHGLDPHILMDVLLACGPTGPQGHEDTDWSRAPLNELADHIVATHHASLRWTLPKLELLIAKARHDRGADYAALPELGDVLGRMLPELHAHLELEEQVLFPQVHALVRAAATPGASAERVNRSFVDMKHDYEEAGREMAQMRAATNGYTAPPGAPTAYQALMEELSALEADLERHAYLENNVLFPRAVELERQVTGASPAFR